MGKGGSVRGKRDWKRVLKEEYDEHSVLNLTMKLPKIKVKMLLCALKYSLFKSFAIKKMSIS